MLLFALVHVLLTFRVLTLFLPHVQSFSCFVVLPFDPAGQCFALLYLNKRKENISYELDVRTKLPSGHFVPFYTCIIRRHLFLFKVLDQLIDI